MADKEECLYFAKLAEQAERYGDMIKYIKKLVNINCDLNSEERSLLSIAYKNYVGIRRTAWRSLYAIEFKEETKANRNINPTHNYRIKVQEEVNSACKEIQELLDSKLIPKSKSPDSQVYYLKMKGDYNRYNAECSEEENKKSLSTKAMDAYKQALSLSEKNLATTNPVRLGLALNCSVFYYEIMGQPEKDCQLAKSAFDSAISDLEGLDDEQYKDSATILQLIKDNLTIWNSDMEKEAL